MGGSMRCGSGWKEGRGYGHGQDFPPMDVPMIPAPAAFMALVFGVVLGVMMGRHKSMRQSVQGEGHGGSMMMHKRMMMGKMGGHHHHGYGMPPCGCGCGEGEDAGPQAEESLGAE